MLPNPKGAGWAQAEDLLVPAFMTLNSNPEASLAWFHVGAPLAAQLFSVNAVRKSHFVRTGMGNVDALRSTLTIASPAGVFRGDRISSLPTNACSTEDNIPFPLLHSRGT